MSTHAVIAPSSLARIVQCPGSVVLSRPFLSQESEAAKEGTLAHEIAMAHAMGRADTVKSPTDEMRDGAEMYAEALEGFRGHPEQTIPITRIHETECSGTPDFWQYAAATKTLRVTDYKFGRLYVDVFENYQLIGYAAGLIDLLVADGVATEDEIIVEFMLVQPRCYHPDGPVRTWTVAAKALRPLINKANQAAHEALGPNPSTHSGPECLFCPARPVCKTAHIATTAIIEYAGRAEAMAQTAADMGLRLMLINEAAVMLKAVGDGLEEQITAMIKSGKSVPGFTIGYTQPREKWNKSVSEVAMLGDLYGKKLVGQEIIVTPKQAVKLGIDRAVVSEYSIVPNGSAKLTPDDQSKAKRIFYK